MYSKDNVSGATNLLAQFTKTEDVFIVWTEERGTGKKSINYSKHVSR